MICKCGSWMIWNSDYKYGTFISWYSCPNCGYDTRHYQNNVQATAWNGQTKESSDADE